MSSGVTWLGIVFCITQSAMFSGLNLALFSISRLRLEVEAGHGDARASRILAMRRDSNFALCTILWGNVAINVLLTLLSESVLAGVTAFLFSTFLITFLGEIIPQAYFSRHAKAMAARLIPVLRFYQILFYPVAKPSALLLDAWLGQEGIRFFGERDFREVIRRHMSSEETDLDHVEGQGALNFLAFDDLPVASAGSPVDEDTIFAADCGAQRETLALGAGPAAEILARVQNSDRKWYVLVDAAGEPHWVLDGDAFLRATVIGATIPDPCRYAHRPIVVRDGNLGLGAILPRLHVKQEHDEDDVVDEDVILVWGGDRRIITGADILGRLLRGIVARTDAAS